MEISNYRDALEKALVGFRGSGFLAAQTLGCASPWIDEVSLKQFSTTVPELRGPRRLYVERRANQDDQISKEDDGRAPDGPDHWS